jgi:hypothetical protein
MMELRRTTLDPAEYDGMMAGEASLKRSSSTSTRFIRSSVVFATKPGETGPNKRTKTLAHDRLGVRWGLAGGTMLATVEAAREAAREATRMALAEYLSS